MCSAVRQYGRNVILDLAEIEAIDAGIGALISLPAAGIHLKIMNSTEQLLETLRFTALDSIFEISSLVEGHEAATGAAGDSSEHAYHATVS